MVKILSLAVVLLCAYVAATSASTPTHPQPSLFDRICPSNQRYHQCKPCYWDCKDRYSKRPCLAICKPGCACPVNSYWDGNYCVKPSNCPATHICPGNQVYYGFCQRPCHYTCDQANQNNACAAVCRPAGCACPSGTFWNGERCVTRRQCNPCPPGVPYHHCLKDPCDDAVCHRYPNAECRANYCGGCKAEFYANNKLIKDCGCPGNQIFYKRCKPCPKHCDHIDNPVFCRQACAPGCGCPANTYWNGKNCVSRDQCLCPANQIYYPECKPCQATCDNPHPICPAICKPGCGCPEGQVLSGLKCVKRSQCGCPANQIYYSGCKPCQSSCDNPHPVCPAVCLPGCGCPRGLTLKGKRCIRPENCGPCPPGVPVVNCLVDPCQFATCPRFPQARCVSNYCGGCNHDFYIGDKKIPKEKCECESNQIYYPGCKPCQSTCENPNPVCTLDCRPGCACRKGLTLKGKKCVLPRQCGPCPPGVPQVQCVIDPCEVNTCPRFPEAECRANFCGGCNAEFFLNGKQIPDEKCHCRSSLNEEFSTCAPPCDATCEEPRKLCSLQERCTRRCACRTGYVRNSKNVCIPLSKCPKKCNSALNERFRACAAPCDATCKNLLKPCSLLKKCTARCACSPGYVRNDKNVCVRTSQCRKCPYNQVYKTCVKCVPKCPGPIAYPAVCLPTPLLSYPCSGGCTCPFPLFKSLSGKCVKIGECPLLKG
uniref:Zonadhesin n=1 Tax=Phallusia mammillata TaxID=59560 RepID=A0A6F9DXU9_9ASCI|nr:zonadhesin [Phallusia mammillata]